MFGAVDVVVFTVISTGSWRYFFEMRRICAGIVAEKSATCLSSGVSARIVSTSSAKPILSISSASSSTRKRSSLRSSVPFSRWSMMRPRVPTTMWTPRRSALSWTPYHPHRLCRIHSVAEVSEVALGALEEAAVVVDDVEVVPDPFVDAVLVELEQQRAGQARHDGRV